MKMAGVMTSLRRAGLVELGGVEHRALVREGFITDQHDDRHCAPHTRLRQGPVLQTISRSWRTP